MLPVQKKESTVLIFTHKQISIFVQVELMEMQLYLIEPLKKYLFFQKTVSTLAGHKKKITDVVFIPNSENISVLVCSEDGKGSIFDSKNAKGYY